MIIAHIIKKSRYHVVGRCNELELIEINRNRYNGINFNQFFNPKNVNQL